MESYHILKILIDFMEFSTCTPRRKADKTWQIVGCLPSRLLIQLLEHAFAGLAKLAY
jgi:hypothetical protein